MNRLIFLIVSSFRCSIVAALIVSSGLQLKAQPNLSAQMREQNGLGYRAASDSILFQDDFSGDLSKWQVESGVWNIVNGRLYGAGQRINDIVTDAWIYVGDTSWTNYEISVRAYFQPRNGGYSNAEILLRSTGHWQNEYRSGVFPFNWGPPGDGYNNRVATGYYVNGTPISISRDTCYFDIPDTADIRIQAIGNRLAVYTNGKFAWGDENAAQLLKGRIGLGVLWDLSVVFDDVVVRELDTLQCIPRLSCDSISFGDVLFGSSSTKDVIVYNLGTAPLTVDTMYLGKRGQSSNREFTLHSECGTIQPGGSCIVSITYHPRSYGPMKNDGIIAFKEDCEFANFHMTGNVLHDPYQGGEWAHIGLEGRSIEDITVGNNTIFSSTADSGNVYRSTNGGVSWELVLFKRNICRSWDGHGHKLAISHTGTVFATEPLWDQFGERGDTLFRSSDNGNTWEGYGGFGFLFSLEVSSIGTIFVGNWSCSAPQAANQFNRTIRSQQEGYVFVSTDDGLTWSAVDGVMGALLAVNHENGFMVGYYGCNYFSGMYVSTDAGQQWNPAANPLPASCLAIGPTNAIYVGTFDGLYRSTDLCTTWTKISDIVPSYILPISDSTIVISTSDQGIFISTDAGNTWLTFNTGLTNLNVHTLALDSLGFAYAGTDNGIFRIPIDSALGIARARQSLQAGWNLMSLPVHPFSHCKEVNYPGACSHAFEYSGSYRIHDTLEIGKGYWLKVPSATDFIIAGYRTELETVAVADRWNMIGSLSTPIAASSICSDLPGMVTSAFWEYNGSAYVASDTIKPGKGYWVKVNQPGKLILSSVGGCLAKSLSSRIRIAAISEYPPPPPDRDGIAEKAIPKEFTLGQNYPNPFNPSTVIKYQLPKPEWVTLKVFDILGQLVVTLMDEVKQPGEYTTVWDAQGMPSGVYFYRLTAGSFTDTKKLLLLR